MWPVNCIDNTVYQRICMESWSSMNMLISYYFAGFWQVWSTEELDRSGGKSSAKVSDFQWSHETMVCAVCLSMLLWTDFLAKIGAVMDWKMPSKMAEEYSRNLAPSQVLKFSETAIEWYELCIFSLSGHCSETVRNTHVSRYFRLSLGALVISTNIRTVGFCVKTAIILQ